MILVRDLKISRMCTSSLTTLASVADSIFLVAVGMDSYPRKGVFATRSDTRLRHYSQSIPVRTYSRSLWSAKPNSGPIMKVMPDYLIISGTQEHCLPPNALQVALDTVLYLPDSVGDFGAARIDWCLTPGSQPSANPHLRCFLCIRSWAGFR